jgi:eukaryotic-like serine/threonine-protein kinase
MSPEQAQGGEIGAPTDVWGIGAVLFEAATAVPPFGPDGVESLNGSSPPSVSRSVRRHRWVPTDLVRVIQGCFEMRPADRPPVMEVSRLLDPFVESRLGRDLDA